ncbi:MAG: anti-sigma F factor [Clostridia bacterium]|nr:anti-sigma F factor [Clostridia bacterium]
MKNYLKAEFDAKSINEGLSRIIVAGFIMPLDPTIEQMADVKTAVSEAVTNAVIHGYENKEGLVTLELITEDRLLTVKVQDEGVGIEDITMARMPLFTSKPDSDRSGMGFTVMESFMDSLHITSQKNIGTTVIMTKKL